MSHAASMKPYRVVTDSKHNRLYISLVGTITKNNMERLYTEVRFGIADLSPGFDVITDLSRCPFGSLDSLGVIEKISSFLKTGQVNTVVRIVDRAQLIYKQATNFARMKPSYRVHYVKTMEEAEDTLAKIADDGS